MGSAMRFNNELLTPERGMTETLPWGAVRVTGRNRPDTVSNPSVYNATFKLVGQPMVDWFMRAWWPETAEGSLPIETSIGWAQILNNPTFSDNTGRSASVTMQLEIDEDADYCLDQSLISIGTYFGDDFLLAKLTLEQAINGS